MAPLKYRYDVAAAAKKRRAELKLTQAQVAEAAGLRDGAAVCDIERGCGYSKSLDYLHDLATGLKLTLPELIERAKT